MVLAKRCPSTIGKTPDVGRSKREMMVVGLLIYFCTATCLNSLEEQRLFTIFYPMVRVHGTVPKRWVSTWLIQSSTCWPCHLLLPWCEESHVYVVCFLHFTPIGCFLTILPKYFLNRSHRHGCMWCKVCFFVFAPDSLSEMWIRNELHKYLVESKGKVVSENKDQKIIWRSADCEKHAPKNDQHVVF